MGAVFNHPWIGYCQKKSRYHLKMIQLVVKVVVVCCFCAQILEGSPLTGGEHGENQIITPEQLRSLQVNKAEMSQMWAGLERGREAITKVEARLEELWQRVDALRPTIDTKLELLMEDLMEKIEVKEKRSLQSSKNFATAQQMDQVMKVFQELRDLPKNVSSMMSAAKQEMSHSLSQAVSREELGHFRLAVARNTALLRFDEGEWVDVQARGQFGNAPDFFARDMDVYVHGFGDPASEFWLGLDKLKQLTREGAQLRIELETFEGEIVEATYSKFRVSGSDYRLTVDGCGLANLNGINMPSGATGYEGILWYFYAKDNRSFRSSRMMIRSN